MIMTGRDSPPEIVQYSRPPENLTSPNRESNSALPQQDIVTQSPQGKETTRETLQAAFQQERNNFNHHQNHHRKSTKRSGSGGDLFQNHSSQKKNSSSNRGNGPLSILRRSFRRSTSKKTAYQVSAATASSPKSGSATSPTAATTTTSSTPSQAGSQERVSRKFSNPYHTSSTAPSPKLLPGRASSPGTLTTVRLQQQQQQQQQQQLQQQSHQTSFETSESSKDNPSAAMKSLVMPEEHSHHSMHSSAVARASEVLVN
jgi:hypothetical protein